MDEQNDTQRAVRIAAVADLHFDHPRQGELREIFAEAERNADILVLAGDMTTHGRPEQMEAFVEELSGVDIPMVGVLGNHDYETDHAEECTAILAERGVHVLNGDAVVIQGVGFAGTKGFAGGFGRSALGPFGEPLIKAFVQHALDEALKLEKALHELETDTRVVVLHYAPIPDTLRGEPEVIYPFLGSSRLVQPIDTLGADVVFHGHAHLGVREGRTPGGVPVFNVAHHVLSAAGADFHVWETRAPERRAPREETGAAAGVPGERNGDVA
ncbi:MAG: metallophosphoesterase [Gemmatimonadota bacterium]